MYRFVPPAGHKIPLSCILSAIIKYVKGHKDETSFVSKLIGLLKVKYCFPVSSGTAALYVILKTLSLDDERDEIIIPAYTCPSVGAAVIKAGLKLRLCDVRWEDFSYDLNALERTISPKTLCIIVVHLFGIQGNIYELKTLCREKGIILVEDAAQGLGNIAVNETSQSSSMLGTIGDIGFYSFGRGKPLNLMHGGAVVTNSQEYARRLKKTYDSLPSLSLKKKVIIFIETALYPIFFHPRFYWIPKSFKFLKLGETIFSLNFTANKMAVFSTLVGSMMLDSISYLKSQHKKSLDCYKHFLTTDNGVLSNCYTDKIGFLFTRLPIIFSEPEKRERILAELLSHGIGASVFYPLPLNRQDGLPQYLERIEDYPNAEYISKRILTLPLHSHITENDMRTIQKVFEEASRGS
jgi:dTDP-4-amino-4,6-dideoxygalactose transaminase